jgi:hypothetical protein
MSFKDTVLSCIDNLKTLEIRTVIGEYKWDQQQNRITYDDAKGKLIMSQIDLLQGDITTSFSPEFLQPPYDEIRKYHAEREKLGHEIIEANLKALKELVKLIGNLGG